MAKDNNSLFSGIKAKDIEPLAERMRPRTLDEFIGQDHIIGPGRLLRRAIQADRLSSVIFSGPPGTGKTTLARVIANSTKSGFIALNAVLAGVADIREAIKQASEQRDLHGRKTILFVDEVHRWNKSQQDALLPWVENGTIRLIGATTENPWFEVNAALVSRSRVFMLRHLDHKDLLAVAKQALEDSGRGYGGLNIEVHDDALEHLIDTCGGDARTLLNALELAIMSSSPQFPPDPRDGAIVITREIAEDSIQKKAILYDKDGDYHFDTISAFIKSIRGSDPDAALYWLARMVSGGEDPRFIFRRLLVSASEDVGLGDPLALGVVQAAAQAFDRVGMPEGQYFLSQATLYLAISPKSNSTMGFFDAIASIQEGGSSPSIPSHLKDGSRDGEGLGHGKGYLYPHAYRDHWVQQNYLPQGLREKTFYQPTDSGWEAGHAALVRQRKWAQLSLDEDESEALTASPRDRNLDIFIKRQAQGSQGSNLELAQGMVDILNPQGHHRLLLLGTRYLFALPVLLQACPTGLVQILCKKEDIPSLTNWLETMVPPKDLANYELMASPPVVAPEGIFIWNKQDLLDLIDYHQEGAIPIPETPMVLRLPYPPGGSRPSDTIIEEKVRQVLAQQEELWLGPRDEVGAAMGEYMNKNLLEGLPGGFTLEKSVLHMSSKPKGPGIERISRWQSADSEYHGNCLAPLDTALRGQIVEEWANQRNPPKPWKEAYIIAIIIFKKTT